MSQQLIYCFLSTGLLFPCSDFLVRLKNFWGFIRSRFKPRSLLSHYQIPKLSYRRQLDSKYPLVQLLRPCYVVPLQQSSSYLLRGDARDTSKWQANEAVCASSGPSATSFLTCGSLVKLWINDKPQCNASLNLARCSLRLNHFESLLKQIPGPHSTYRGLESEGEMLMNLRFNRCLWVHLF